MSESLLDIWDMRKRGKRDSTRHQERIKKAIKKNLHDLISNESIIGSDGKKKVKIPIRSLDNYRFKYSDHKNQEGVGQGNKDGNPGDAIAHDGTGKKGQGKKAGQEEGDMVYEEVELSEVIDMMLEDLNLPWLEKKDSTVEVETEEISFTDIAEVGPLSNVDKKRTVYENMKRNAKQGKVEIKNVHPDDLRYKVWEPKIEYHSNAAVYCLMDRSGSMDMERKYIARAFFFWLVHFCKTKYKNVELVFIAHDTTAKIVPEKDFFTISNSGGTMCSSAYQLALDNINENHPPDRYNNYVFAFSDGDCWGNDAKKCVGIAEQLLEVCAAVGYGEIDIDQIAGWNWSTLHEEFEKGIDHPNFLTAKIKEKGDVYDCLKKFLNADSKENG